MSEPDTDVPCADDAVHFEHRGVDRVAPPARGWLTIGRSFLLWLLGVVLLTLILVSALVLTHEQRVLEEELVTSWRMMARLVAVAVAEGGVPEHLPVAAMSDLRSLEVHDGRGRLLWRFGPEPQEVMTLDDSVLRLAESLPMGRDDGTVEVVVLVSRSRMRRHLAVSAARLVVGLCLALGVALVVGVVMVGWIARPIRELADRVRGFDPDRPTVPDTVRGASSEVAELTRAFAEMAARLGEQRRSIAASEHRFRELVASSPTPMVELDDRLRLRDANPAAEPFLGCGPAHARGMTIDGCVEGGAGEALVGLADSSGADRELSLEARWRLPGGETAEVELRLGPLGDGWLMVIHDLTDRVRRMGERWRRTFDAMADGVGLVAPAGEIVLANRALEQVLAPVADHLCRQPKASEWQVKVGDRLLHCSVSAPEGLGHRIIVVRDVTATARSEARLREAEKMEAVGTLAGGIAHDFNNLLAGILLHARWLQREPAAVAEAAEAIRDLAEEGVEVVRELLLFARRESTPHRGLELGVLVRELAGVLRHLLPANAELELRIPDTAAPVLGNPVALRRLVLNLVLNARDAVADRPGRIEVVVEHIEDRVVLVVADDGVGVAAEHRDRLFEPFFSVHRGSRGAGLGLAVVHSIVSEHRGSISVDSEEGRGTRITVALPAAGALHTADGGDPGLELAPEQPRRVLLVEHDGRVAARLIEELVAVGLDVRHAPSPEAADELLELWSPDAVVADLGPGASTMVAWLGALGLPLVVASDGQQTAATLGLDRGAGTEVVDRPPSPERVLLALQRAVRREQEH